MEAILEAGAAEAAGIAEIHPAAAEQAMRLAPNAALCPGLNELLALNLDGIVIATPSALHAEQVRRSLEAGLAVFCQKPLGRNASEVESVVQAARTASRLLSVDLSYRETRVAQSIRTLVAKGELGKIYAVDLVFHNAYGPDKPWFYDPTLSGGGCVMDLGIHLVDLALWVLGFPAVDAVASTLFTEGEPLRDQAGRCESFGVATLSLATGAVVRLACSWNLQAGQEAVISAAFYGTGGGAALGNVGGSFYDFRADRFRGTTREVLAVPPDTWGGRAAVAWARRVGRGEGFDPAAEELVSVARVLDRIYDPSSG